MAVSRQAESEILIADDQSDVLEALHILLKPEGFRIHTASSPRAVIDAVDGHEFDLVLMDLNYTRDTTSGDEGLDILTDIHGTDSTLPIIVMTAWGTIDLAVEAMRRGARDFIQKPWENQRLLTIVRTQIELCRALRNAQRLESENRLLRTTDRPTLIAESPAMRHVLQLITRVAPSDANILITGEHGTGKEVVAHTIHALSNRAGMPLVTVNAGGLADGVFESELFGHTKGAYTDAKTDRVGRFELADKGTLFLDEIANVPLGQQSKLLRVVEAGELERVGSSKTRKVNVRVIAATNADLSVEVDRGRFRPDLLFRLNTIEVRLPALRDRREDIPHLASYFLRTFAERYRSNVRNFQRDALQLMTNHPWPGNVRELSHAVERGVLMAREESVSSADLGLHSVQDRGNTIDSMSLDDVESFLVRKTLTRHGGNVSQAAKALGLSRSAMYRRIQKYNVQSYEM